MGCCGQSNLKFYDGTSTDDAQLDTVCFDAYIYEFQDVETTGFSGHIAWTVTTESSDYYGFLLVYRTNSATTTTAATTTTTAAPDTTTTTTAPDSTTTTTTTTVSVTTTTDSPGCNASLTATATTAYFTTENYPNNYDSNMNCHILITSPTDTAITLTFVAFTFEADTYCTYDYFAVYDYSTVDGSTSLIGTYCGTNAPGSILSSNNASYIVIYSDGSIQRTGANVGYAYSDNSYPNCKAGYTSYTATSTVQSLSNTNSPYLSNQDEYFLVENPRAGSLILQLSAMSIERASGCTYDRLTIYNGACTKNTVLDIHCGTFLKRWELTGTEYLVHFHTDSSIEKNGFTLQYFLGVSGTGGPTTTTTTIGPPVSAEVFLINDVLTNYSTGNFLVRNLSTPVESVVEVYLAGVNSLDEVQQKLTTTIQFELTWYDDGMKWPTSKLSGISKILMPQFSTWSSTSDQVQTIVGSAGMRIHENFVENSEWKLEGVSQRNETINGQLTAVFTLRLKRNHSFIVFYVTIPVILLSLLNSLTFALPVSAGEKSGYAITVFLSFLIYVIVTFQKMPDSSDTISLFAIYVLIMTGMSNLTVIISVLEIRMMELKTKHKPMLQCTISFTKMILNLQHRFLCIKEEMDEKRSLEEQMESTQRKRVANDDDDDDIEEEDKTWPEFVSALDFVCFWVFFYCFTFAGSWLHGLSSDTIEYINILPDYNCTQLL